MRIVETDNFGRDYPDEKFVNVPSTNPERAKKIADAINEAFNHNGHGSRYWKVVEDSYKLEPGFEP